MEPPLSDRHTICFPHHGTQDVLQHGDAGFKHELARLYPPSESDALEALITLKQQLRSAPHDAFWSLLTEGLSKLLAADLSFVVKRVLVDDHLSAVEMPPIGEPGSCIMATAFHYHSHDGARENVQSTKFHAYGCPCAYMRHDKVFLIPERLNDFITNNPNSLPMPCDAYIALPLFHQGKCFGHFGAMWSVERAAQRRLSWPVIEMLMHSFEDMICARFLEAADFQHPPPEPHRVVPHEAVTAAQSLRPYAGSLSHELRTPMQGIVGMLDVMHATVEEAVEGQADPAVRAVFDQLRQNIEIVQDSSRRAVEAADNVVHAYDMDMSIPEAPTLFPDDPSEFFAPYPASIDKDKRPDILVAGSNLPLARPNKRRRDDAFGSGSRNSSNTSATAAKAPRLSRTHSSCARCARDSDEVKTGFQEAEEVQRRSRDGATHADAPSTEDTDLAVSAMYASRIIAPGLRHTSLRELLQYVINEGLKVGGRPDTATAFETESGETVEVRTRGSDGSLGQKTITWNIDSSVPTTMFIDEKDLSKLISCVFLNALKFTDKYNGRILVDVTMSQRTRFISIRISDNGPGIPAAFLPRLFTPFSQQNGSITRSSEGLGLGLMVAKGIARKLGGDLKCVRAEIEGPHRGTEFEIKVPLHAGETISRSGSPFGSPLHTRSRPRNGDSTQGRPSSTAPNSPHVLSRALHEAVETATFHTKRAPRRDGSSPPPSPKTKAVRIKIPVDEDSSSSSASSPTTDGIPSVEIARTGPRVRKSVVNPQIDRNLAEKYPLTFLVAEDNKINRKLLVSMLSKFGYTRIYEAHDGAEAVRQMTIPRHGREKVDVVLMDLWMPFMDGYEATERILNMPHIRPEDTPTVLAVTADVTDGALERAAEVGMKGFMTKPFKLHDLQRLITEYCASHKTDDVLPATREN